MANKKPSIAQKVNRVRRQAELARSPKGVPLPKAVVERICALQHDNPEFNFWVGSSESLARKKNFFAKYHHTLELYDENGLPFVYSGNAVAIRTNKKFIGISYSWKRHQARVYAFFPFG